MYQGFFTSWKHWRSEIDAVGFTNELRATVMNHQENSKLISNVLYSNNMRLRECVHAGSSNISGSVGGPNSDTVGNLGLK